MSDLMNARATYKRKMALKKATKQLAEEIKAKQREDASALRKVTKPPKNIQKEDLRRTCSFCDSDEHLMGHYNTKNKFIITCEKALESSYNKTKREKQRLELNKKWVNQVSTDIATNRFKFNETTFTNNTIMRPSEQKNYTKISKNKFDMGD
jgi:hypothetical protein